MQPRAKKLTRYFRPRNGDTRPLALLLVGLAVHAAAARGTFAGTLVFRVSDRNANPVACRIHLKDATGKPIHPLHLLFWRDHFVCSGRTEFDVAAGRYTCEIERGPEYRRVKRVIDVAPTGRTELPITLTRIADMPSEGWYAGDLHIHRGVADIPQLIKAEDLHVAPVITWWRGRKKFVSSDAPATTFVRLDANHFYEVMAGEDERGGGALLYFGLKHPLPVADASLEYPSPMKFLNLARAQRDASIDVEKPFWWDVPVWIASGHVDSIELANNHMWRSQPLDNEAWGKPRDRVRLPAPLGNGYWSQEIYYQILNSGLRIPPTAGSASGVHPNPVGYNRVYAQVGTDLTRERWWDAVKAGRSFVTNGPLLRVTADGQPPGHIVAAKRGSITVRLSARLSSNDRVPAYEIVRNGEIVRALPTGWNPQNCQAAVTDLGTIEFESNGWFLVRAITDNQQTFRFASTAPFYVEIGDLPRRISRKSALFFRDWVAERMSRINREVADASQREEILGYHRVARAFWEKRLSEANAP